MSGNLRVEMTAMKRLHVAVALALATSFGAACEDITNPVEEFGALEDPYVRMEFSRVVATPETTGLIVFVMPTRVEEDVEIDFTFGGDAVFGEDFVVVDADGNPRTDITAAGGTATIEFDPEQTLFGRDTLRVFVPFDATDGRTLEVEITAARAESGRAIETGFIDRFRTAQLAIEGFVDIPFGTYVGTRTGDFGSGNAQVTITKPATPITAGGETFLLLLSDYSGDAGIFGIPIPWALSVTSGGTVLASSASPQFGTVTSDVVGTFNFDTNTLTLDVELTCCGAAGFGWRLRVSRQ